MSPIFQALPEFLAEIKYQNITTNTETPFQKAFNAPLSCFGWLPGQPERFGHFQQSMAIQRGSDWLSTFPFKEEVGDWSEEKDSERAVFVDVGGEGGNSVWG